MADIRDIISNVRNLKLGRAINNVVSRFDQDKEQSGFQFTSPKLRKQTQAFRYGLSGQSQGRQGLFSKEDFQRVGRSFKEDPGRYSLQRLFAEQPENTTKLFKPVLGQQRSEDLAYGIRGATQLTPFNFGLDKRTREISRANAPTTQRQREAQSLGRSLYGYALTAPLGGPNKLFNVGTRAATNTAIGAGFGAGVSAFTGGDIKEGAKRGAYQGFKDAPYLAVTNPIGGSVINAVTPGLGFAGRQIAGRTTAGVINVLEDEFLNKIDGLETNNQQRAISFLMGAALSQNKDAWDVAERQIRNAFGNKVNAKQIVKKAKSRLNQADTTTQQPTQSGRYLIRDGKFAGSLPKQQFLELPKNEQLDSLINTAARAEGSLSNLSPKIRKQFNENIEAFTNGDKDQQRQLFNLWFGENTEFIPRPDGTGYDVKRTPRIQGQEGFIRLGGFEEPELGKFEAPYQRGDISGLERQVDQYIGYQPTGLHYKQEFSNRQKMINSFLNDDSIPQSERNKLQTLLDQVEIAREARTEGPQLPKAEQTGLETQPQKKPLIETTNTKERKEVVQAIKRSNTEKRLEDKNPVSLEGSVSYLPKITKDNKLAHNVSLLDYFRTPDKVLEKIGLGKQAKQLRDAHQNYVKRLPEEIEKITEWWNRVGNNQQSSRRIFKYLDGQDQKLTQTELEVAKEIRSYLESWADELGLPKDKRIANYITHIFENDLISKEFDPDLEKIIADKVPGSVYNPFLQKRLGKKGYVEDVFRVLDAYVKRSTRKVSMDPALDSLKGASENLPLEAWNYVKNYADRINLRPTEIDNLLDNMIKQSPIGGRLGSRPVANVTRKVRNATYRATLGLNVGSAIRNLTQGANTYATLGEKYTARGYFDTLNSLFSKNDELERVGVLSNSFIQDRNLSAQKQLLQKIDEGLWFMFDTAEKINRGAAYYGAKAKAIDEGKTIEEAIQEGVDTARKTQFTFSSIDTPIALQGDLSKTLLQFQSYNVKQLEFLGDLVKEKNVAGLARYFASWMLFAYAGKNLLGFDIKDSVPFASDISEGETRIGKTPAIQTATGLIRATVGAEGPYGDEAKDSFVERLQQQKVPGSLGASLIPGFVQGKKTFEGIKTARQGYSESASGRVRTPVEQGASAQIRGALFGQYSNEDLRNYFDNERTPLSEKQTSIFKNILDSKGLEDARKYYDSVIEARDLKKNVEEIKESALKGKKVDTSKLTTSDARDVIKSYIEAGVDVSNEDLYTAYLYKPLSMADRNKYEQSLRNKELFSSISNIEKSETLSDQQKQILKSKIASEVGITEQELDKYQIAKQNTDSKTLHFLDQLELMDRRQFVNYLVNGRKPINGSILSSDKVINNLVDDGIIPEELGKILKNIDYNSQGQLKKKKSRGGRSRKPKVPKIRSGSLSSGPFSTARIKTSGVNL